MFEEEYQGHILHISHEDTGNIWTNYYVPSVLTLDGEELVELTPCGSYDHALAVAQDWVDENINLISSIDTNLISS